MNIGKRLRELREAKGLSQGDMEKRSGLLRSYISRIEAGHTVASLPTLEKLARALEVEPYQLLYKDERKRAAYKSLSPRSHARRKAGKKNWRDLLLHNLVTEGYGQDEARALVDLAAS